MTVSVGGDRLHLHFAFPLLRWLTLQVHHVSLLLLLLCLVQVQVQLQVLSLVVHVEAIQPSSSSPSSPSSSSLSSLSSSSSSSSSSHAPPLRPQIPFGTTSSNRNHQHQHQHQHQHHPNTNTNSHPPSHPSLLVGLGGRYPQSQSHSHPILLPQDILYHEPTKVALQILRQTNEHEHEHENYANANAETDADSVNDGISSSSSSSSTDTTKEAIESLYKERVCNDHAATLTLVGYKGRGGMEDQINQDRAFVHSPFRLFPNNDNDNDNDDTIEIEIDDKSSRKQEEVMVMQLMGVMDGHGHLGEHVSEYCVSNIPKLLNERITRAIQKLKRRYHTDDNNDKDDDDDNDDDDDDGNRNGNAHGKDGNHAGNDHGNDNNISSTISTTSISIENILRDVFSTINATIPTNGHGGCTASISFRCGNKIYVANVGDSKTFLFAHHAYENVNVHANLHAHANYDDSTRSSSGETPHDSSNSNSHTTSKTNDKTLDNNNNNNNSNKKKVQLIYESREDKPHLHGEKERIEECGGVVYIPPQNSMESGHDSSRVIVIDRERGQQLSLAMSRSLGDWSFSNFGVIAEPIIDVIDLDKVKTTSAAKNTCGEDVNFFVVSATDGLLDYVTPDVLGEILGRALYENSVETMQGRNQHLNFFHHTSSALEEMVLRAAQGWYNDMGPTYRDDIAIAVMKIL